MNSNDIILRKPGDSMDDNQLPRGVRAMIIGNRVVFIKRMGGRFMPVSEQEQKRLEDKHVK